MNRSDVTGIILAGGQGRRMGGVDKGLLLLHGRPLVDHIIAALRPQVGAMIISANRNLPIYQGMGYPVVSDNERDGQGPLAGIASAMLSAHTPYVFVAPCDVPSLPTDLVAHLMAALIENDAQVCCASVEGKMEPLLALMKRDLVAGLLAHLAQGGRKVTDWLATQQLALYRLPRHGYESININTPEDLAMFEAEWCDQRFLVIPANAGIQ